METVNGTSTSGAFTWGNGSTGTTLDSQNTIDAQNSIQGPDTSFTQAQVGPLSGSFVAPFPDQNGGSVLVGIPSVNVFPFALASGQTVSLTPAFLTLSLGAGTNVTLQASDDITINSPIKVTPSGSAGSLALEAGRSILLNAGIDTGGGNLALIANQSMANGVVDPQRDKGNAAITMAAGITLNTGVGTLAVDLKTTTDKTNNGQGAATLLGVTAAQTTVTAASVLGVSLNGTTPGNGRPGTYTQTNVTGPIDLGGATLQVTSVGGFAVGQSFAILASSAPITTRVANLQEGDAIAAHGQTLTISYLNEKVTLTVTGNHLPTVQFRGGTEAISEQAGTFRINVSLLAVSARDVTVPFTLGGTAEQGADYSGVPASPLVIPAGSTSGTVTVTLIDDDHFDRVNRTLTITLGTPTNAALGSARTNTLTISEDNDPPPTVQFTTAGESVNETDGVFSIAVTLSAASDVATTVPFTLHGTAVAGTDYNVVTGNPLVIPAGSTGGTITGTLLDDDRFDTADRTLIVTLGTPTNASLGNTKTNTLTIAEDSDAPPTVQFSVAGESISETGGKFNLEVTLSAASEVPTTVPFTLGGSAVSGIDFNGAEGPLVIPAGKTSGTIQGMLIDDNRFDAANRTMTITLGTPTNGTLGSTTTNALTITEDSDPPPIVQFSAVGESVGETAGQFTITVTMAAPSESATTVPFTLAGSAVSGTDYSGVTASPLVIPAGSTTGTITGMLLDDNVFDAGKRTMLFSLGTPTNATLGTRKINTLTIVEDSDAPPVVQFSTANESISETASTWSITVTLSAASESATTVPFTVGGTAAFGTDFTSAKGPLTIPAGSTSGTIVGTLIDDGLPDSIKKLTIKLGTPAGAALGAIVTNTLTITEP